MAVDLHAGAVIADKLRLVSQLGQGGMGVVWAARHLALDTDVAVKFIRPERVAADPALIARFEREARTTARIAHPHVLRVMDYGTVDGVVPYIVMELLRGFSLAELLERGGRLSLATAAVLVEQVGSALESAHQRGVVHRDIKPHNLFILEETGGYPLFVKVLDFGIAKMLGDSQVPGGSHTLTEEGTIIGSPPYMSPEQLEGSRVVDLRVDLWSFGVIVYESLTAQRPFEGRSFVAVGAAALKGLYRPATELRPGLPLSIDDWFAKALSVDPDGRFQSAAEMVEAFQELARAPENDIEAASGEAEPSQTAAFATAVDAALLEVQGGKGGTEGHAPLAEKRQPLGRGVRWRRALIASVAGIFGIVVAIVALAGKSPAVCPDDMKMIRGATFKMGAPAKGETLSEDTPQYRVKLDSFCLDVTEVTVAQYSKCTERRKWWPFGTSCAPFTTRVQYEDMPKDKIMFWSQFCNAPKRPNHPVNCIDWDSAKDYCEAEGKRLPTEDEWEFAARGKKATLYPWGDAQPSAKRLNACGTECSPMLEKAGRGHDDRMYDASDGAPATAPVGQRPAGATGAGVNDMAGNVWEWTSSYYDDSSRVIRGGGWDTFNSQQVRAAQRRRCAPSSRLADVGFRCAKSL